MARKQENEGCVTVTWEIQNFSLFLGVEEGELLKSPQWKVDYMDEKSTSWRSLAAWQGDSSINFNVFTLDGSLPVDPWQMSIVTSDGEKWLKGNCYSIFCVEKYALFGVNGKWRLRNDTLILRAWMHGKAIRTLQFCINSALRKVNHKWKLEHFDSTQFYCTCIEQDSFLLYASIFKNKNHKRKMKNTHVVTLEIPYAKKCVFFVDCAISIKDSCVKEIRKNSTRFNANWICDLAIHPENNSSVDVLLESIVALHDVYRDQPKLHSSSTIDKQDIIPAESPGALGEDLLLLYKEKAFSDVTIISNGISFPVYKGILATRSPVFRTMFKKVGWRSRGSRLEVRIDDVDSDTLDRMLGFLYSGVLEELHWEQAWKLYHAAVQYEVWALRQKCADVLKTEMTADNACDVLVLADKFSDQELVNCVVDFIRDHQKVFSLPEWKNLEKDNPRLTTQIFREVFVKK